MGLVWKTNVFRVGLLYNQEKGVSFLQNQGIYFYLILVLSITGEINFLKKCK